MRRENTKTRAIKEAGTLFQRSGYDGFSLQDVADIVGVKKASLYEHFKSKEDLLLQLVDLYVDDFELWARTIRPFEPKDQVNALFESYIMLSNEQRLCTLSSVSIGASRLPESAQVKVKEYCAIQQDWLLRVIADGQEKDQFRKDLTSTELAEIISALSIGAQIKARALGDPGEIKKIKDKLFTIIGP